MNGYNLITLNASKILDNFTVVQLENRNYKAEFHYDLSDNSSIKREIILSTDKYDNNALFYQIEQTINRVSDKNDDILRQVIIFVDFDEVFKKIKNFETSKKYNSLKKEDFNTNPVYRLRWIFDANNGGITLTFNGNVTKTFVPFDKSASMSRNCKISFIDKEIKPLIDDRLLLGINFSEINVIASKYYAYRGLYLSSGYRIEQNERFTLNHETVIVIDDLNKQVINKVFTAKLNKELWECYENEENLSINLFDGEGLISPEYANFVSDQLKVDYNFGKDSHSFQVRMPFTKGVLHSVNFKRFLIEEKLVDGSNPLEIKDVFGMKRDLNKAQIILTKSMLKCCGWLKDYWKKHCEITDIMEFFFQQMKNFKHTMYVTGTDARFSNTGKVRLNYQFLSTLALKGADLEAIVKEHIDKIENVADSLMNNSSFDISDDDDSIDDENDITKQNENIRNKCLNILSKNKTFVHDPKIKAIIQEMQQNYKQNLCIGRFEVQGQQRYLSGDLLHFLIDIAKRIENVNISSETKKELYDKCLYSDRFYMAVSPEMKFNLKYDKFYSFLRNPHLSRNEHILLRPYTDKNSLYEKYFSHLTGTVMVASDKESLVPMALSGADMDGDLVKIVSDKSIVETIKNEIYEVVPDKRLSVDRKIPVISIPAPKNDVKPEPDKGSISFETITNTFSNNIGLISNIAVDIATKEYSDLPNEEYKNKCAECTIVTGLEIDAAKTGVHPRQNITALSRLASNNKDVKIFFELKKKFSKNKYFTPWIRFENPENTLLSLYGTKRQLEKRRKPTITNINVYDTNSKASAIERLPGIYCKYIFDKRNCKIEKTTKRENRIFFEFQKDDDWKSNLEKEKKSIVAKIVKSYLSVIGLAYRVKKFKESQSYNQFTSYVFNILQIQYDSLNQKLINSDVKVEEALNQTYANIRSIFNDGDEVKLAIKRLIDEKWQFTKAEERTAKISIILGIDSDSELITPAMIELLSNFNNCGFMVFYYVLKDIQSQFSEDLASIETYIENDEETRGKKSVENDLIEINGNNVNIKKELLMRYYSANEENESKTIWNKDLINICRKYLNNIFDNNMNEAIKYLSQDTHREFFWNIFSEQEIKLAINKSR